MSRDEKPVKIIEYSPKVEELFTLYEEMIQNVLPDVTITHIGSFAVPMTGKAELDVLIEVDDLQKTSDLLGKNGFGQGPVLKDEAFLSNYTYDVELEIHLVPKGSPKKELYLSHVKKLQEDKALREEVTKLKQSLNGQPRGVYREKKARFFKKKGIYKK
jgi:GrpB-like predicted nucleotidyltransferase (UPF0157 family)